jgi:hypothetical protein
MNAWGYEANMQVSHRLATHPCLGPAAMQARGFDAARSNREWLIFHCHDHRHDAAKKFGFAHRRSAAMSGRLNAFFAISVNSPSLSMVNFSCCVGSAPKPGACGVTRRVAPQPMRAAVRMEAGADACL